MAVENFTTFTELDAGGFVTINSANSITIAGDNSSKYSLYSDKGENHFSGDFEHLLETQYNHTDNTCLIGFWGLGNNTDGSTPHDLIDMDSAGQTFLYAMWYRSTSTTMYLRECDAGTLYTDSGGATNNTPYYCEIERDEATGTYGTLILRMYTDSDRTSLYKTLSLTLHTAKTDFRTIYAALSYGTISATCSVDVDALDLQEAGTTHTVTGAITLPALEVSGTASKRHVYEATGAVTLPALEVSGQASKKHVYEATGAITLPALEVSGTASKRHVYEATGAITLPALEVSGTATKKHVYNVTGAIELPALEVAGQATRFHTWEVTGAVTLPALEVAGTAEIAISLAGGGETDFQVYSSEDEDYVTGMALVDSGLLLNVDWKQRATEVECL